ncbi:hypothetical protein SAMN02910357_02508 [Succinivibrio dextrinosolvens]|uniref:hypothetical protein n=1 Tax=Succinivibrio dextrinosolvens TaxID=83771 RepID=UPI0008E55422|nr:hypothetical protein [Succinivibrio dextrinosolvens]SFS90676.1 hypothetical protein SAMN02910357_02508 [Succinivibrio dextrinosolvens]
MFILNRFTSFIFNLKKYKLFYFEIKYLGGYTEVIKNTQLSRNISPGKRIYIYGFGPYGQEYFIKLFSLYKIIDIFDLNFKYIVGPISNPEIINSNSIDYVIVTVMNENAKNNVVNFLLNKGISLEKIIFVNYL